MSINQVATAGPSALSLASFTELLEALGRPTLPPVPVELARLVTDYLQAGLTIHGLRDARPLLQRCAPEVAHWLDKIWDNKRGSHSLEGEWADHPGVPVAITLVAVWMTTVAEPLLSSPARPTRSPGHQEVRSDYLDQWIEALLPVGRYLEPVLHDQPRPNWRQVMDKLQDKQWVANWIGEAGDSELVQSIADHAARPDTIGSERTYGRRRRNGVVRLYRGIQTVLGEGPLPAGYITGLLPRIELAPGTDRPFESATVTLSFSAGPRPGAAPLLPLDYIARAELPALVSQLTSAPGATRAIILSGITGVGKTTLAAGLAREPAVVAAFPDGILWSTADQADALEELCRQAGLVSWNTEPWPVRWRQWAGDPARRALVILDDVVDAALLAPVAGGLGPQMALVVTTQFGDAVATELARWLPAATIQRWDVTGLSQGDAQALFEHILGRALTVEEVARVSEVGQLLGWHAGALAFAAAQAREYGWAGLLAGLREGGLPADRLRRMVQRQWERLSGEQRADLAVLVRYARQRGPFGLPYAMAAWNVKQAELAEMRLAQLARAGLVERLQAQPGNLYLSAELWRVTPVVAAALRETGVAEFAPQVRDVFDRLRLAGRLQGHAGSLLRVPWQFQLLATAWWLIWGTLKLLGEALVWVYARVTRAPHLLHRWRMWTLPNFAEEHLQRQWQRLGIEPTQEVGLIYDARTVASVGRLVAVGIAALALLGAFSLTSPALYGWGLGVLLLLALGVVYWILRPGVWRTWLAYLYGVDTWDLRLILRACRILGMREQQPAAATEAPQAQGRC